MRALVSAPKQRNTDAEKKDVKEGRIPEDWKEHPAGFLQLILTKPVPPIDDPRVFAAHVGERMRFYDSQKVIEGALLTAREAKQRR
jgi:hypothetical protein